MLSKALQSSNQGGFIYLPALTFHYLQAQQISKAIGQAFNMAYRQFLKTNGISHDSVEEAEYCHVLESQKIVGQDLDLLADSNNTRDASIFIVIII